MELAQRVAAWAAFRYSYLNRRRPALRRRLDQRERPARLRATGVVGRLMRSCGGVLRRNIRCTKRMPRGVGRGRVLRLDLSDDGSLPSKHRVRILRPRKPFHLRDATPDDVPAIHAIYAIMSSTGAPRSRK